MPAPDPEALDYYIEDGRLHVLAHLRTWHPFWGGGCNRKHRVARATAVLRKLVTNDWACGWCGGPVPIWRRADARFCREACRKRMARWRREVRG